MSLLNVVLRGVSREVLEKMISRGYANTQSEAIRLAVISFGKNEQILDELAAKNAEKINSEIKRGRHKVLSVKQLSKKHPEFRVLA